MNPKFSFRILVFISTFFVFSGCSYFRASPAMNFGFLPNPDVVSEHRERAPFNGYWVSDETEYDTVKKNYSSVYVAPVDASTVVKMYQESDSSEDTKIRRIEEASQLANYFQSKLKLILEIQNYTIVEEPQPDSLVVRLALVQVVPTSPGINILGTIAGFFLPGGGIIKALGEGSVAFEGYVEKDRVIYEQYKDREGQKYRPFSIKDYQRYAHIRQVLDEWSMQIIALITTDHGKKIDDSDLISINPL